VIARLNVAIKITVIVGLVPLSTMVNAKFLVREILANSKLNCDPIPTIQFTTESKPYYLTLIVSGCSYYTLYMVAIKQICIAKHVNAYIRKFPYTRHE